MRTAEFPDLQHWYDLTCPFCSVGQQRTCVLLGMGMTVTELPFQVHPEVPDGGLTVGPRIGPVYDMLAKEAGAAGRPLDWLSRIPNLSFADRR